MNERGFSLLALLVAVVAVVLLLATLAILVGAGVWAMGGLL